MVIAGAKPEDLPEYESSVEEQWADDYEDELTRSARQSEQAMPHVVESPAE